MSDTLYVKPQTLTLCPVFLCLRLGWNRTCSSCSPCCSSASPCTFTSGCPRPRARASRRSPPSSTRTARSRPKRLRKCSSWRPPRTLENKTAVLCAVQFVRVLRRFKLSVSITQRRVFVVHYDYCWIGCDTKNSAATHNSTFVLYEVEFTFIPYINSRYTIFYDKPVCLFLTRLQLYCVFYCHRLTGFSVLNSLPLLS